MKAIASLAMFVLTVAVGTVDALAQAYPSQSIRFIVPFPPGGGTDTGARIIAQKLGESLGQAVVVDNRPGAAGIIGTELAAKAPPDGYTLLMGNVGTHAVNPSLYRKLPYDPVTDFAPISQVAGLPMFLLVAPSTPARSVKELIALAKAKPGQLNYGSAGNGNAIHIAAELFKSMSGAEVTHIPYKGGSQVAAALMAGEVQMTFLSILESLPNVKAERMRPLAVTSMNRSVAYPDLPTVAEAGLPGYESISWLGIFAPAGTPRNIITKLNTEIVKILAQPEVKERLQALGAEPIGNTPEQFAAAQKADIAKYAKVLQDAGIQKE